MDGLAWDEMSDEMRHEIWVEMVNQMIQTLKEQRPGSSEIGYRRCAVRLVNTAIQRERSKQKETNVTSD